MNEFILIGFIVCIFLSALAGFILGQIVHVNFYIAWDNFFGIEDEEGEEYDEDN